jgi:hypothetical protein
MVGLLSNPSTFLNSRSVDFNPIGISVLVQNVLEEEFSNESNEG